MKQRVTTKLTLGLLGKDNFNFLSSFPQENTAILQTHEDITEEYDFVFCLSYTRIIPNECLKKPRIGVFLCHSSNLPQGRGWAPLQWSVLKKMKEITVTLLKANEKVDAGPWLFKLSFPILESDTIDLLYKKDLAVSKILYKKLITAYKTGSLIYHEQVGEPEYWQKRTPLDSELDPRLSFCDLWDQIRVCDNRHYPAFFWENDRKIFLYYKRLYRNHPDEPNTTPPSILIKKKHCLKTIYMMCRSLASDACFDTNKSTFVISFSE